MKINWKAGIVCFLFLMSLGMFFNPIIDPFLEPSWEFYVITTTISSIYLTAIFLYTLHKNKEDLHTRPSILKNTLIIMLLTTIFVFIYSLVLSSIYPGGHPPIWAFLFLTPLIVIVIGCGLIIALLFFTIPTLLLYKFRNNKKIFRFIYSFFVVIFILLAMFLISSFLTCNFYENYYCVADRAVKAGDIQYCEKTDEYHSDYCYLNMSRKWKNSKICKKINDQQVRSQCEGLVSENSSV